MRNRSHSNLKLQMILDRAASVNTSKPSTYAVPAIGKDGIVRFKSVQKEIAVTPEIKTAAQILAARYLSDEAVTDEESGDRTRYHVVIDGNKGVTPWMSEDDLDSMTSQHW